MEKMAVAHKMDRFFSFMGFYLFLVLGWYWWKMGVCGAYEIGNIIGLKVPVLSPEHRKRAVWLATKNPESFANGRGFLKLISYSQNRLRGRQ